MNYIEHLKNINDKFPNIVSEYIKTRVVNGPQSTIRDQPQITETELQQIYQNERYRLIDLFQYDIEMLYRYLYDYYGNEYLLTNLINIPALINYFLTRESDRFIQDTTRNRGSQSGGKFTYKGRKYVIRQGERSGKYILVKGKKMYLSQI